jgi:hypothetical protein
LTAGVVITGGVVITAPAVIDGVTTVVIVVMIMIGFTIAIGFEQFTDEGSGALAYEREEKQPGQQSEGDIHPPQLFVMVGSEIWNHSRYLGQSIDATPQQQRHPDDAGTEQQCRTPTV